MRIVHISDCYAPRTGGIETQVRDLAAHQARAGHAVHVLTATADADGARRTSSTEPGGARVHRFASAVTFGLPVHPLGGRLLRRALERLVPDVVHVHAGLLSPFAHDGARAARALGLPLAITWHCMLTGAEPYLGVGARLTGWDVAPAALSAVSTVAAARVADALGRPTSDVAVVTNGLDLSRWVPGPAVAPGEGDDAGPLRVVATQRLAPRKRALPLLRAFARAADALGSDDAGLPRIVLTLAGTGPEEAAVRREVERLGVGDVVTLLGRLEREELAALYHRQDVFLSATELEAFGIAALEARASGLAVVARAGTGIAEFVTDGVDGLLAADDAALAAALVRLASDAGLRGQILAHNRAVRPAAGFPDVLMAADREYARAATLAAGQRPPPPRCRTRGHAAKVASSGT